MSPITNEWDIDALDLHAYLERVRRPVNAAAPATSATLAALHRAHLRHIPFENIDVILRRAEKFQSGAHVVGGSVSGTL